MPSPPRVYPGDQLARAQAERLASAGQVYEITARVSGRIGGEGAQMLILDMNGVSLEIAARTRSPRTRHGSTPAASSARSCRRRGRRPRIRTRITSSPSPGIVCQGLGEPLRAGASAARGAGRARAMYETSRSALFAPRAGSLGGGGQPVAPLSEDATRIYPAYRSMIAGLNPRLSPHEIDTITTSILYYSGYYQIDPRLIVAMIVAESGFDPKCTSRTGAMGLGQLMPGTAAGLGVTNAYDPVQNIGAAVQILSGHVQQYGGTAPAARFP